MSGHIYYDDTTCSNTAIQTYSIDSSCPVTSWTPLGLIDFIGYSSPYCPISNSTSSASAWITWYEYAGSDSTCSSDIQAAFTFAVNQCANITASDASLYVSGSNTWKITGLSADAAGATMAFTLNTYSDTSCTTSTGSTTKIVNVNTCGSDFGYGKWVPSTDAPTIPDGYSAVW